MARLRLFLFPGHQLYGLRSVPLVTLIRRTWNSNNSIRIKILPVHTSLGHENCKLISNCLLDNLNLF